MNKKKKIILISVIAAVAVIIIAGIIFACVRNFGKTTQNTESEQQVTSKAGKLYDELSKINSYSVTMTKDDKNKMYYAKNENKAYTDNIYNGEESKFIIRDGNSYLVLDNSKTCYTYMNNETDLKKVENQLLEIKDLTHEDGEEKIENKKYDYEEYQGVTSFTFMDISQTTEVKTRFYFDKDKLVYIKTIIGDEQELVKVDISYDVDRNIFEIPSDYEVR